MNVNTEVRIGLLGAARIAPPALIRPAQKLPGVQVLAVAARDPARARAFAQRHGIPRVHDTYQGLIQDPDLDAVYIPLPNSLHAEWSTRALEAGKHVLCEKPLASNADEARRMAAVAARTGRTLAEAFHYRYHPLASRLKAIVDSGELGTIRHLEAHFCVPVIFPGNIRYRYDLGGGATMDLGCYTINLLRYLSGAEPAVVRARARLSSPQVDRFMDAEFAFPGGRTGRMVCSLFSLVPLRSRAAVQGTEGELRVSGPFHPHLYHRLTVRRGSSVRREPMPRESTFTYQLQAFVEALRTGGGIMTNAADAIANLQVIDAVYEKAGLRRRGLPPSASCPR
ncbi:MAG TPA: Gfo/Idh/MocA family oxidoreductase [Verrucomicrobiota bacterium]|nr:Gfo/Idh/MocA family oxidoreductase [Verrucomicrobiota bacterium]HNU52707.1 Gfo/Idh/MocA family oxidoreductase [Verrucomicrobiota bacterium]